MINSRKRGITRYYRGQSVILGLILLALGFPVGAQAPTVPTPIAFGQTVQGTLDFTDPVLRDFTRYDAFALNVPAPGRSYFITVRSPDIPLYSALRRALPGGALIAPSGQFGALVKFATTSERGELLSYTGVLRPGRYLLIVNARFLQQQTGPSGLARYTLRLLNVPL